MTQEILEKVRLGLEAKDFESRIENGTLYLCIDDSQFELSNYEIEYQAKEHERLHKEESENFKEHTIESIINTIEEHHSIDEYEEDGELCGYEMNTYTNGGVNMILFLDFRDSEYNPKNPTHFLKVFEDRIESIDIDEEIVLHREMKDYTNNFTLSESLEDFNDWRDDLNELIEKL